MSPGAETIVPLLRRHQITVVIHLAAIVSPGRDYQLEHRVDVEGTSHLLEQVVFRIGTIPGQTVANQITRLWGGPRLLAVRGSESPFVFVWVDDVAAAMVRADTDGPPRIFNLHGHPGIIENLGLWDVGVQAGLPLVFAEFGAQVVDCLFGHRDQGEHGPWSLTYVRVELGGRTRTVTVQWE